MAMVIRTRSKTVNGGNGDITEVEQNQNKRQGQITDLEHTLGDERGKRTAKPEVYIKKENIEKSILNARTESKRLVETKKGKDSSGGEKKTQYHFLTELGHRSEQVYTGRNYKERYLRANVGYTLVEYQNGERSFFKI